MKLSKKSFATLGLIFITFLAAIQYIFLRNVPEDVSTFSFVFITNVMGFLILGLLQFKKLIKIEKKTLKKGLIFAVELTGFNFFVLLGSRNTDAVIVSSDHSSFTHVRRRYRCTFCFRKRDLSYPCGSFLCSICR